MPRRIFKPFLALLALVLALAACSGSDTEAESAEEATTTIASGDDEVEEAGTDQAEGDASDGIEDADGPLTVYSGRSEELVGPILATFTEATGIEVEVRYGDTAEMAALILEEGDNSPADVYFGQDAGALGALADAGSLSELPAEVTEQVAEALRSPDGEWVGVSGRQRVVVYNTDALTEADLPDSMLGFTDPAWKGRIAWAPSNGSFQAFVTALRVLIGEDGAREWLEGIVANEPVVFDGNSPLLEAVGAGEVEVGFTNHYYLFRFLAENPEFAAANKYYGDGDPGALVNVAGVGVVASSDQPTASLELVEFLLSTEAQEYFASETFEIPLSGGVPADPSVPDLDSVTLPEIDLNQLEDLAGTLQLLTDVGAL